MNKSEGDVIFLLYIYSDEPTIFCVPIELVPKELQKNDTIYDNDQFLKYKFKYHKYFGIVFEGNEDRDDYEYLPKNAQKKYKELMNEKAIFEKYQFGKAIHTDNMINIYTVIFSIQG